MDSITQAALGAAIGEATLGRKVGNKAPIWGAVVGSLPDLDVLFNPLMDQVTQLTWHRGYSHSILLNLIAAFVVGWLLSRLHRGQTEPRDWIKMSLYVLIAAAPAVFQLPGRIQQHCHRRSAVYAAVADRLYHGDVPQTHFAATLQNQCPRTGAGRRLPGTDRSV